MQSNRYSNECKSNYQNNPHHPYLPLPPRHALRLFSVRSVCGFGLLWGTCLSGPRTKQSKSNGDLCCAGPFIPTIF